MMWLWFEMMARTVGSVVFSAQYSMMEVVEIAGLWLKMKSR
jgi:hypothetical protein